MPPHMQTANCVEASAKAGVAALQTFLLSMLAHEPQIAPSLALFGTTEDEPPATCCRDACGMWGRAHNKLVRHYPNP